VARRLPCKRRDTGVPRVERIVSQSAAASASPTPLGRVPEYRLELRISAHRIQPFLRCCRQENALRDQAHGTCFQQYETTARTPIHIDASENDAGQAPLAAPTLKPLFARWTLVKRDERAVEAALGEKRADASAQHAFPNPRRSAPRASGVGRLVVQ